MWDPQKFVISNKFQLVRVCLQECVRKSAFLGIFLLRKTYFLTIQNLSIINHCHHIRVHYTLEGILYCKHSLSSIHKKWKLEAMTYDPQFTIGNI